MKNQASCYISMKEIELSIPLTISDITLSQYRKYLSIYEKWDKEDEDFIKTKILQVFGGLKTEDTFKLPIDTYNESVQHIIGCLNTKCDLETTFTMSGKDKYGNDAVIEFGLIPNIDKISYGEFIDLEKYINSWDDMHKAMAVLYRPIIKKRKDSYIIDDYGGSSRYSDVMLDAPINVVLGVQVFFYRLGRKLPTYTMDYLLETLRKEEVLPPQLKQTLGENGDGINQYIHSLKEMLEESMKSPDSHSINV